ncbi:MAG: hypothetical protein AMDU1_APLC00008G0005 [Thermoplasmatales archaeon A-plasma]|jgi:hypothetical protein|nr:MAG: hypothetical protein AMDU1_APLC00008G0005 [Thermoplasmatales archaeon A-plasma]
MIKGGVGPSRGPEHVKGDSSNSTGVFNNSLKPKRYGDDALNKGLLGRRLRITLINGQTIEGILSNLGMYDLSVTQKVQEKFGALIRDSEKTIIVMKAGILTVEVV